MPGNQSVVQRGRRRLAMAMLVLVMGPTMAMAGFHLAGSAAPPRVAIAAKSAGTDVPDAPTAAATFRQVPLGAGPWRSGLQRSRELREALPKSESPSWGPGDLRVYLLRSTAATHRGHWLGETSAPEFS